MESFSGQQYGWNDPSENQLIPHSFSEDYTNVTLSSSFTPQQIDESWLNRKSQLLISPELEIGRITQDLTDWGKGQTSRLGEPELFSSGYSYTSVFPTSAQSIEQDIHETFPLTQPESSSDLLTGLNIEVQNQEVYLAYVKQQALNQITSFSQDANLGEKINTAFGDEVKKEDFQNQMKTFEFPEIRLISIEQLNAKGGFDGEKIYLAQELLLTNTTEAISVLIEELGHYIDQQLNKTDALGDEGAIFAALVQNQPLTQATLAQYQTEDDHASIILDGQSITIEQASLAGTPEITATTDIGEVLTIPDIGQTTTPILFQWTNKEAQYNSEVGYYLVDEEGRVDGIAPEDPDYALTVLNASTTSTLFSPDQQTGDWQQIDIPAGYHLAFYLIANGTRNQWLNTTDSNHKPNAFFSINGANLDGFDHSRTENLGTGIWRLSWEDLLNGGDQDFNDVVLTISQPGLIVPGQSRQNVPLDIDWVSGDREADVEMGFFFVDNPLGQIGALLPGDPGYAQAALSSPLRQTVFRAGQFDDGVELTLPSGQYLGWYLINGGTTEQWLSNNPQNHQNGPIALFSYASANPDGLSHLHYQTPYQLGWETSMGGGDKDYDDLVFRFGFGAPNDSGTQLADPSVPSLSVNDISVLEGDVGVSNATFTVSLSQSSPLSVTVDYTTQALSTTHGTDYQPLSGQLTFAPGEIQKTLTLAIYGDDIEERNETFALVLSQPVNAVLADDQGIVTIIDDDQEAEEDDDDESTTDSGTPNPGIVLREHEDYLTIHQRTLAIPSTPSVLSFTYESLNFDTTDPNNINDGFEVALLGEEDNSIVYTISDDSDAFFNLSEGNPPTYAQGVSIEGQTVTLDLSRIIDSTTANLVFRLINNDADTASTVNITDISLEAVSFNQANTPFNRSLALSSIRTIDFEKLEYVSSSIETDYGLTTVNEDTQVLSAELALENIGSYPIRNQLIAAVTNISDPAVTVIGIDGQTPDGLPYFDFSHLIDDEILASNQSSQARTLSFYNPDKKQFTYDLVFLGQLNQNPVWASEPNREVKVNHPYHYQLNATDFDGDRLSYELLASPDGLMLDQETHNLSWTPTEEQPWVIIVLF